LSIILLLAHRWGVLFNHLWDVHALINLLSLDFVYVVYLIFVSKCNYTFYFYSFVVYVMTTLQWMIKTYWSTVFHLLLLFYCFASFKAYPSFIVVRLCLAYQFNS
jgi:hypothetical protein